MTIQKFEDIVAWQKGRALNQCLLVAFEGNKNLSFKDQLFRASLSITNNIAEGFERGSDKQLKQFLIIARGSTAEVRSMLYIALDAGYITDDQQQELLATTQEVGRLLTAFIKTLNSKPHDYTTIQP